jgi:hypothetical protein
MISTDLYALIIVGFLELLFVALQSRIAVGKPNATTRDGALLTISKIDDLTKWMATLEVAILGGLAYLVLGSESPLLNRMNDLQRLLAMFVGMNFGISLLLCGWLLTSLGSIATRVYGLTSDSVPKAEFDVVTWSLYGDKKGKDAGFLTLNYFVTFKHWFWGLGLGAVAALVISLMMAPPQPPDKKTCVTTGAICTPKCAESQR